MQATLSKKRLRAHQTKAVRESPDKWGLWFKMRVGKSPTAIRLVTTRCKSGLIICPKGIVKQWEDEIRVWGDGETKFKVISRDQFKIQINDIEKYEAVICDEVHRGFANYKALMYKALMFYIKRYEVNYIWLLTGTPFTSSSWSVYSYGKILGKKWKWFAWSKEFFTKIRMGRRWIPIPRYGKDKKLQNTLRSIGTVIDLKDVAEIADDIDIIEEFKLNKEQIKRIDEIDEELPVVEYIKQRQIEQGVLKSDGYNPDMIFTSAKDKRLIEIVANYEKIIIVCKYTNQVNKIAEMLKYRKVFVISGQVKETASEVAEKAENSENCVVVIQSDTCDGYSLKSFDTMVFASMSYSFVNYDQIRSRMKSMEKKTACTYIHLLIGGKSIDRAVQDSVFKKQNFSIELYEKR